MIGTSRNASRVADRDVTFLNLDVASDESVTAVVQVIERYGRLDVLVNNAGIGSSGAAEETSVAQDQSVFDINVLGVIRMTKAVLPHMRAQRRGRIINVSSILGFIPQPFMAVYAASKHAVEGYSESLDHEVRVRGLVTASVESGGRLEQAAGAVAALPLFGRVCQSCRPAVADIGARRAWTGAMISSLSMPCSRSRLCRGLASVVAGRTPAW